MNADDGVIFVYLMRRRYIVPRQSVKFCLRRKSEKLVPYLEEKSCKQKVFKMPPKATITSVLTLRLLIILAFQCEFGVTKSRNLPYADESFLRLESGENSDEVVNHCCKRDSYLVTVGYGLNDNEIRMDVGRCRQSCDHPAQRSLKREEFDKYLKKYPNIDPLQIFLTLQSSVVSSSSTSSFEVNVTPTPPPSASSTSTSSCVASKCQPSGLRMERVYLGGGIHKEVEVVDSCDCIKLPHSCQRTSRPLRIHVDTPYERTVDVGVCGGGCGSEEDEFVSCKPIRNKTISVEGPNGAQCMNTIEECGCAGNCYRVREFLKVFDYKEVFASNGSSRNTELGRNETVDRNTLLLERNDVNIISGQELSDEEAVGVEPTTKVIDVGRCEGSCGTDGGGRMTSKCLEWRNGTCVSSLYGGRSRCFPSKLVTHDYTDRKGSTHQILSVISCACH